MIFLEAPDPSGNYTNKMKIYDWKDAKEDDYFGYIDYTLLRKEEFTALSEKGKFIDENGKTSDVGFTIIYSTKAYAEIESLLNFFKTLFICLVLGIAAHYFTKDASSLVLDPLERMIEKV